MNPEQETRQPFRAFFLISTAIALTISVGLLSAYFSRNEWQLLAVAGIAVGVVAVHGIAWGLVRIKEQREVAVWLIATAQILGIILAALFLSEFWYIGALMLMVVPIEVGIADRLRRIPIFLVLGFFGASGMIA
ncbi:MAG TPA: hypothetical protein VJZ27_06535, partial [Aggregatilineales bacterium]|nr:hypothetical protein [Aggregatilineales bacterium]